MIMKSFYYIAVLFVVCVLAQDSLAQTPPPTRTRRTAESNNNNNSGLPELSVRARARNTGQGVDIDNVVWLRILYREIDLTKEVNAPLYFPTEPIGDRMNLFTLMFKLLAEGKLTAYQYIDEKREIFTDRYKVDFEGLLKDHHVLYQKTGTGPTATFVINENDIPSSEVLAYYVKEATYFDQATGTFGTEVLAICPIQVSEGDFGENMRVPWFWVPYENLRPYISRSLIMTSNYNNALTYTTDDFFQINMYQGNIIKAVNLMGLTLAQQFPDSTKFKLAQDSIERQLRDFEARLWVPKDTVKTVTTNANARNQNTSTRRTSARAARTSTNANNVRSTTRNSNAASTPTRSVRRR